MGWGKLNGIKAAPTNEIIDTFAFGFINNPVIRDNLQSLELDSNNTRNRV